MRAWLVVALVGVACGAAQRPHERGARLSRLTAAVETGADIVWTTFRAQDAADVAASLRRWPDLPPPELEAALARLDAALDGYANRLELQWQAHVAAGAHAEAAAYAAVWRNMSRAPDVTLEQALTADPRTQFLASYTLEHVPLVMVHQGGETSWDLGPLAAGGRITAGDLPSFARFLARVGITPYVLRVGYPREIVSVTRRTVVEEEATVEELQLQLLELGPRVWRCSETRPSLQTSYRTEQEYVLDPVTGEGGRRALVTRQTSTWVEVPGTCREGATMKRQFDAVRAQLERRIQGPSSPRTREIEERRVEHGLAVELTGPGRHLKQTLRRPEHHRQTVRDALDELLRATYRELMPRTLRGDRWAAFAARAERRAVGDFNAQVLAPLADYRGPAR